MGGGGNFAANSAKYKRFARKNIQLRRLPRVLPPRVCLPYTYVNFNGKCHKTKIEFFDFPSVNVFKILYVSRHTFVNLNTDFHKIQSKDFFNINFEPFSTLLENVSMYFF